MKSHSELDGGWAWLVCAACFLSSVITDGLFYSFGVVFVELLDYFKGSKGETVIITSIAGSVCFIIGPFVAVLINKFGCRAVVVAGGTVCSVSQFVSIFAPNLQFLYVSLGVMTGIGYGLMYLPSMVAVTQYFEKKRALATGIAVSGTGIGTFIFSPITNFLIETYTWQGAFMIASGLLLNNIALGLVFRPLSADICYESNNDNRNLSNTMNVPVLEEAAALLETVNEKEANANNRHPTDVNCSSSEQVSIQKTGEGFEVVSKTTINNSQINEIDNRKIVCDRKAEVDILILDLSNDLTDSKGQHQNDNHFHKVFNNVQEMKEATSAEDRKCLSRNVEMNSAGNSAGNKIGMHSRDKLTWSFCGRFRRHACHRLFDIGLFTDVPFCMFVASTFFYNVGYYVPYIYLPDMAGDADITMSDAAWLVSSIGITSSIGRVLFGYLADRPTINRLFLYNTSLVICGIATAVGALLKTYWALLVYTAIFGVFSGVTVSLTTVILTDIVGIDRLADAFGVTNFFSGVASFVGPSLAGWLYDVTGSYLISYICAGVAIAVSGVMLYFVPMCNK